MAPDLNVLLAAFRTDHPHHEVAYAWLLHAIAECETGGSLEILPMVAVGFLRLATNPKVFVSPAPIGVAIAFVDSILATPGAYMPELAREWPTLKQMSRHHDLAANEISDAWIAATVRTLGIRLVTFDRDFIRVLDRTELTLLKPP